MNFNNPFPSPDKKPRLPPVIRIEEDRSTLAAKLAEYRSRLTGSEYDSPELIRATQLDTIYKIEITKELVEKGEVDIEDFKTKLIAKYGSLDIGLFDNACFVMLDYIRAGGKHLHGGTGLPKGEGTEF